MTAYWIIHVQHQDVPAYRSVGWEIAEQKARSQEHSIMLRWMGFGDPTKPTAHDIAEHLELAQAFESMGDGA